MMTKRVWPLILVSILPIVAVPSARALTNIWQVGGVDTFWTTAGNWDLGDKPGAGDQARFQIPPETPDWSTYEVTIDTAESVESVVVDTAGYRSVTWLGSGSLDVTHDFSYLSPTIASCYFKPTLTLNGIFYTSPLCKDTRSQLKFGDAGSFTSGNTFLGGIDNSGFSLSIGGSTTFGDTGVVRVAGSAVRGTLNELGHYVKIEGTPSFGTGTTFDLNRGGVLWFPAAAAFDNVGTLRFNGGMLRLDAASGYTFPVYSNGFEVKRGLLAIAGNASLGASGANAITLGSTGGFGALIGGADNSPGNHISRHITLTGNGGIVDVWGYFLNTDMNFAAPITGSGMLIKTGNRELYLRDAGSSPAASSYSGGTTVAGGELHVESTRTLGSGNVRIGAGGRLVQNAAGAVDAGATVRMDGPVYSPGKLVLRADMMPPAIDADSAGTLALWSMTLTNTITSIGSAFLGSYAGGGRYAGTSLPPGPDHIYRIGGVGDVSGYMNWENMLNLDVNAGADGDGVLTGDNDVLVAYGGCWLRDINTFAGALTVRRNVSYGGWAGAWCQAEFQPGGSPLGETNGAVNLENGGLYFWNGNAGLPIAKGALNLLGQNYTGMNTAGAATALRFASLNRTDRAQWVMWSDNPADYPLGGGVISIHVDSAPVPVNGIVDPWLTHGWGTNTFLGYGANGFTTQGCFSDVVSGAFPTGLSAGTNVIMVTGAAALGDNPDIYALRADANLSKGAGTRLTLRSGGLILNGGSHDIDLSFGAAGTGEAIIFTSSDATLSGTLTTSGGLTKGGPVNLALTGNNTATLSGKIVVNGGYLSPGTDAALGNANNVVCLNGGAINGAGINHTISIGAGGGFQTYYYAALYGNIVDDGVGPGGPLVIPTATSLQGTNTFTGLLIVGPWAYVRLDNPASPSPISQGPVLIQGGCIEDYGGGWTNLSRFTLLSGLNYASAIRLSQGAGGASTYRIGSIAGDGNVSWGSYGQPPAGSGLIVGGDNTSCDYFGSIFERYSDSTLTFVVKEGTGTWTLWGDNTWHAATTVSNGTLEVNGSIEFSSGVTVKNGATLSGKGYLDSPVTVETGGTLAGSLVFPTNVTLSAGVNYSVTLNGTSAVSQFGQMTLNGGTFTLAGSTLNITLGTAPVVGSTYMILNNAGGTISGQFASGKTVTTTYNGKTYTFAIDYAGGTGNDIVLTALAQGALLTIR